MNLLAAGDGVVKIDEPGIGSHLGVLIGALMGLEAETPDRYRLNDARAGAPDYFFSREFEAVWRPALRRLLLERLGAQVDRARLAVLKEPHGSEGADVVMACLPRSRLIFLLRDGRDVIDSELDAATAGSWAMDIVPGFDAGDRMTYIRRRAHLWLWRAEVVQRAFDAHPPALRRLVRYEDLRTDPRATLESLADWLNLDDAPILRAAERTAFEHLPPGKRGRGQFIRAAQPGLWRENLSPDEQLAVMEIIGAKLEDMGYESTAG